MTMSVSEKSFKHYRDAMRYGKSGAEYWIHDKSGVFICDPMTKAEADAYITQCANTVRGPYFLGEINRKFISKKKIKAAFEK